MILWARAARCLLVAGLTCFLCPRGVVAFLVAVVVDFFDDEEVPFFAGVFVAVLLEAPCFFAVDFFAVDVGSVVDVPAGFAAVSSLLFPSAGITARKEQRTAASTRTLRVAKGGEKTDCIFPM